MFNYSALFERFRRAAEDENGVDSLEFQYQKEYISIASDYISMDLQPSVKVSLILNEVTVDFSIGYYNTTHLLYLFIRKHFSLADEFTLFSDFQSGRFIIVDYSPFPDFFFTEHKIHLELFIYSKKYKEESKNMKLFSSNYFSKSNALHQIPILSECLNNNDIPLQQISCLVASTNLETIISLFDYDVYTKYFCHPSLIFRQKLYKLVLTEDQIIKLFPIALTYPNAYYGEEYTLRLLSLINQDSFINYFDKVLKFVSDHYNTEPNRNNTLYSSFINHIYHYNIQLPSNMLSRIFVHLYTIPTPYEHQIPSITKMEIRVKAISILLKQNKDLFFDHVHSLSLPSVVSRTYYNAFMPCGLINYNNSCFINALVQMLSSLPPLLSKLDDINSSNELIKQLMILISRNNFSKEVSLRYDDLFSVISTRIPQSETAMDIGEFFSKLLNNISTTTQGFENSLSFVIDIVDYNNTGPVTKNNEILNMLTLNYSNDTASMTECIDSYLNQILPNKLERKITITQTSDVIIIQLMGEEPMKIFHFVNDFMEYSLACIVAFKKYGSSGHYIAYVNRGTDWFYCNDSHINVIHADSIYTHIFSIGFRPYFLVFRKDRNNNNPYPAKTCDCSKLIENTWCASVFQVSEVSSLFSLIDTELYFEFLAYFILIRFSIDDNAIHYSLIELYYEEPLFQQAFIKRISEQNERTLIFLFENGNSKVLIDYLKKALQHFNKVDEDHRQRLVSIELGWFHPQGGSPTPIPALPPPSTVTLPPAQPP